MTLFKKKNEDATVLSLIKNDGAAGLLIWRYPEENFTVNATLRVMPGEQAIFIKNGAICQVFNNGTYELSPDKYSFIKRLINKITGKVQTFNCVVYFVNAADTRELKWGTQTPIQVRDKVYGIRTDVKARGAYKIRINNAELFLRKLVGSNVNYRDSDSLDDYFVSEFQGKIKSAVSKFLNELEKELIGIDEYLDELSRKIEPRIDEIVGEYGLRCVSFSIAALDVDISKYEIIDRTQLESIATIKKARSDRGAMDILGDGWEKQRSVDMFGKALDKNGTASIGINAGSFGCGMNAVAGTQSAVKNTDDPVEKLKKLKSMYEEGLIDEKDYNAKKTEILNSL